GYGGSVGIERGAIVAPASSHEIRIRLQLEGWVRAGPTDREDRTVARDGADGQRQPGGEFGRHRSGEQGGDEPGVGGADRLLGVICGDGQLRVRGYAKRGDIKLECSGGRVEITRSVHNKRAEIGLALDESVREFGDV